MTINELINVLWDIREYSDSSEEVDNALCVAMEIIDCFPQTMEVNEVKDRLTANKEKAK